MTQDNSAVALYALEGVHSVEEIESRLAQKKLKLAQVLDRPWIWLQCFSMERESIFVRNAAGKMRMFFFSWGELREWEPQLVYTRVVVAVEVEENKPLPRGMWRYEPVSKPVRIIDFLGGHESPGRLVTS